METIGMRTTTSGGETDSRSSKVAPVVVSPSSIDFQSSEEPQQWCVTTATIEEATEISDKSQEIDGTNVKITQAGPGDNNFQVEVAVVVNTGQDASYNNETVSAGAEIANHSEGNCKSEQHDDSVTNLTTTTNNFSHVDNSDCNPEFIEDETDREKTPVPNFCVEGSGGGDSSVTVVAIGPLSTITGGNSCLIVDTLDNTDNINGQLELDAEDVAGSGSAPISVQSSEDMKLSLVSWYSEPEESPRDCCNSNLMSRAIKTTPRSTGGKTNGEGSVHDKSDEKENKTPMRTKGIVNSKPSQNVGNHQAPSQRLKMHVQLFEQNSPAVDNGKVTSSVGGNNNSSSGLSKKECPRCARRSKSGTTTPAAPSRTPRRVVQSSKSTQELKKPIKSILKSDSRGSGSRSGSGSEKQSSMDSLGSASGIACVMTRSDGGSRTKFNFNSGSFSSSSISPEERTVAKLKRIEKYATLRLKKSRVRSIDFNQDDSSEHHEGKEGCKHNGGTGVPVSSSDIMSKSMSFLEKSTLNNVSGGTTLKRQGSLRIRRPSPMWEPSGTRTSALRMQKVQEAKAKTSGTKFGSSSMNNSGSNHSGSGESIHTQSLHNNINNCTSNGSNSGGQGHHNSASTNGTSSCPRPNVHKEKHLGAKIFSKLSSAIGQTTSSAMKRLKQERGVQTDPVSLNSSQTSADGHSSIRISPLPALDQTTDEAEQMHHLENLVQRYRTTALRFQQELERSEERNRELTKQVQETQSETTEMIDFLQAEKSMLAESLTEIENEGKKWQEQVDSVKKEAQSRCSSLVRLSEQHKQEALKSQALLNRLEVQSNAIISKQSAEMSEAALNIQKTRQRIVAVIEKLLRNYKVPHDLLASAAKVPQMGMHPDDTELNSSLLVPLISALLTGFPAVSSPEDKRSPSREQSNNVTKNVVSNKLSVVTTITVENGPKPKVSIDPNSVVNVADENPPTLSDGHGGSLNLSNSLQNLNQAILDREAAENLDGIDLSGANDGLDSIHDGDHLSLKTEIDKLNSALYKLVTVVRIIVVHCDKKVSGVTSNILQCLRSIEDEKVGRIPEMINVQKSLEAWSDSTQCQTTSPVGKLCVENGHSNT
ncbi:unnamed protein product [Allacma fusca]|uniref:Uncharacterized protein n=1 Tax=Allacma fusca TaxID=39272 RepID=A0A8J2LJY3_9HEXA|nr:unnamed protein product [Allacma fusca]